VMCVYGHVVRPQRVMSGFVCIWTCCQATKGDVRVCVYMDMLSGFVCIYGHVEQTVGYPSLT
jgi:hypothetical protein